jgi:hypothetical protein
MRVLTQGRRVGAVARNGPSSGQETKALQRGRGALHYDSALSTCKKRALITPGAPESPRVVPMVLSGLLIVIPRTKRNLIA